MCTHVRAGYTLMLIVSLRRRRRKKNKQQPRTQRQRAELPAWEAPPQKGLANLLGLEVSGVWRVGRHDAVRQVFSPTGESLTTQLVMF